MDARPLAVDALTLQVANLKTLAREAEERRDAATKKSAAAEAEAAAAEESASERLRSESQAAAGVGSSSYNLQKAKKNFPLNPCGLKDVCPHNHG